MATSQLTALPATRTAAVLDDADSRPGSATSLLRTIIGCYLRRLGGWIAAAALMELMTTVGVNQTRTRTAILRVRGKGLLAPEVREGRAGYALEPAALPALARGDRRIYSAAPDGHVGPLVPDLVLDPGEPAPASASATPPAVVDRLWHRLGRAVDLPGVPHWRGGRDPRPISAYAHRPRSSWPTRRGWTVGSERAVGRWWDLPAIAARHQAFLSAYGSVAGTI